MAEETVMVMCCFQKVILSSLKVNYSYIDVDKFWSLKCFMSWSFDHAWISHVKCIPLRESVNQKEIKLRATFKNDPINFCT